MKVESNLYKTEIKRSKKKIKHLKHKKKKETPTRSGLAHSLYNT